VKSGEGGYRIGKLSSKYETSGRGPGTVSTGIGDKGGVSYGSYQLASKMGTVGKFLIGEGAKWEPELRGLDPTIRGGEFGAKWKEIAARSPSEFHEAQHQFIQRTHYEPVVGDLKKKTGLDVSTRSSAVKDAVWSAAVQHGGVRHFIIPAVNSVKLDRADPQYDFALVNAIYDYRKNYVNSLEGMSDKEKARENARYKKERADALIMLKGDQS